MDIAARRDLDGQHENSTQRHPKKKSALPVPVRKVAHREALGAIPVPQQTVQNLGLGRLGIITTPHQPVTDRTVRSKPGSQPVSTPKSSMMSGLKNTPGFAAGKQLPQRTPKSVNANPKRPLPSQGQGFEKQKAGSVSLAEEQQLSGLQFQTDTNALRSIITNKGISMASSGTVSEMYKPQRVTEGQGRPVYTPHKMRHSVYSQEPRMSLMDSCKQYRDFLRQERGLDEVSESASPSLSRPAPRPAVSESPLVKGMKSRRVPGSVYPQYTLRSLVSPRGQRHVAVSTAEKENETPKPAERHDPTVVVKDKSGHVTGTPVTPMLAFGRVTQTATPSAVTPARRVLVYTGSSTGQRSISKCPESSKKRLRWADILGTCSPQLSHTATTQQSEQETSVSSSELATRAGDTTRAVREAWGSVPPRDPLHTASHTEVWRHFPHSTFTPTSLNTADVAADGGGDGGLQAESSSVTHNNTACRSPQGHTWSHSGTRRTYTDNNKQQSSYHREGHGYIDSNTRQSIHDREGHGYIDNNTRQSIHDREGHGYIDNNTRQSIHDREGHGYIDNNTRQSIHDREGHGYIDNNTRQSIHDREGHGYIDSNTRQSIHDREGHGTPHRPTRTDQTQVGGTYRPFCASHSFPGHRPALRGDGGDDGDSGGDRKLPVASRHARDILVSSATGAGGGGRGTKVHGASSSSSTLNAIFSRLQTLEQEERRVQHEMQLLRMAMHADQDGDSNGNNAATQHKTTNTIHNQPPQQADGHQQVQRGAVLPPHDTTRAWPAAGDSVSMAPPSPQCADPTLPFAVSGSPSPPCNDAFCSQGFDSDSSSSPDINFNVIGTYSGKEDAALHASSVASGEASLSSGTYTDMAVPNENDLALLSAYQDGGDNSQTVLVRRREENVTRQSAARRRSAFVGLTQTGMEGESGLYSSGVRGTLHSQRDDTEEQLGSAGDDGHCGLVTSRWSVETGPLLAARPSPGQKRCSADLSLRHSVDMDVEDDDDDDDDDDNDSGDDNADIYTHTSHAGSRSPMVPEALDLAGQDWCPPAAVSSCDQADHGGRADVKRGTVIVWPRVTKSTPQSTEEEQEEEQNGQHSVVPVSPPIWTSLALQSAARNINHHHHHSLAPSRLHGATSVKNGPTTRPPLYAAREVEAVTSGVSRNVNLSPKPRQRRSPAKRSGAQSGVTSPSLTLSGKRPSLHGTLKAGGRGVRGVALTNHDVFLEALLEDECALYAGRLQSFFRDNGTARDRLQLPDPVATVLSHGDDMHFMPICEDPSYLRPALKGSAFACYVPF